MTLKSLQIDFLQLRFLSKNDANLDLILIIKVPPKIIVKNKKKFISMKL